MYARSEGGANYCCGGIEDLDLGISAHNTRPSRFNPRIYPRCNPELRKPPAKELLRFREKRLTHGHC